MLTTFSCSFIVSVMILPLYQIADISESDSKCQICEHMDQRQATDITSQPLGAEYMDNVPLIHRGVTMRPLTGKWQLSWNDEIGNQSEDYPHECSIEFKEIDGNISGDFVGPVTGRERNAIISGELTSDSPGRVFNFRQQEDGYACHYQAIDTGGAIVGVWHDTENRSGMFRLLRYQ